MAELLLSTGYPIQEENVSMLRIRHFAIAATLALLVAGGQAADLERTHQITLEDYFSVNLITESAIAPDGKTIAYSELRWGGKDERRNTDLWVVDVKTGQRQRLMFEPSSDSNIHWDPDSFRIYFATSLKRADGKVPYDGTRQIWMQTPILGEPFPITRIEGGINAYEMSADATVVYYTKSGDKAYDEWEDMRKKLPDVDYAHGVIKYSELWKLDLESWREEKLVAEDRVIREFAVSPDEKFIAMITTPDHRLLTNEGWSRVDIYNTETKTIKTLPDKLFRADAPSPFGWVGDLAWSADGHALAFTVGFDGYPTMLLAAEGLHDDIPAVRVLKRPEGVEVSGHLHWRPRSDDLCFLGEDHARRRVYMIADIRGGKQGADRALTPGDVVVHNYSFNERGDKLSFVMSTTEHCRDIFLADLDRHDDPAERITNVNPQIDTWKLPQIQLVEWEAPDGATVQGILELPPDYTTDDGPLPMVVEIHGGPTAATLYHLRYWIYGRTLLAAKGYALLSPNYRGSTGYGDKFMTDLIGSECDIEVKDILAGVDAMIDRGIADPEKLGVMGWSNGGFLTNCLIVSTNRFKAASSGAGVADQLMQWALEDTPGHVINYMRGLPWERTEAYLKASPSWQLNKVTTPTIVHVGGSDPRVPPAHSELLYRALKDYLDVPAELLVYPGEGHGLSIRKFRGGKLEWDIAWFDRYILGKNHKDDQD